MKEYLYLNFFTRQQENVLLRSSKNPNHVIDWEKFAVDRHKLDDTFTRNNTNSEDLKVGLLILTY